MGIGEHPVPAAHMAVLNQDLYPFFASAEPERVLKPANGLLRMPQGWLARQAQPLKADIGHGVVVRVVVGAGVGAPSPANRNLAPCVLVAGFLHVWGARACRSTGTCVGASPTL